MKTRIAACLLLLCTVILLVGCSPSKATVLEMELTSSYSPTEPFINEKLFYVNKDTETLALDITLDLKGESGLLEIADNETGQVYWSDMRTGTTEASFSLTLNKLTAAQEYVLRFTGTKIEHAKITVTSDSSLAKERERPQKARKTP